MSEDIYKPMSMCIAMTSTIQPNLHDGYFSILLCHDGFFYSILLCYSMFVKCCIFFLGIPFWITTYAICKHTSSFHAFTNMPIMPLYYLAYKCLIPNFL